MNKYTYNGKITYDYKPGLLSPETMSYVNRARANGGEVISIADVDMTYKFLKANNLLASAVCCVGPQFGLKKDTLSTTLSNFVRNISNVAGATFISNPEIKYSSQTAVIATVAGGAFVSNPLTSLASVPNGTRIRVVDSTGKQAVRACHPVRRQEHRQVFCPPCLILPDQSCGVMVEPAR